jgi:2-polyprenyl-6-methoxyphenol hydroxylase-like FAD-dependent oxidoreductase
MEKAMNTSTSNQTVLDEQHNARFDHAVVIGSSIAGLLAARVLTDHFNQVTIVDRDGPPDPVEFHRGAPQTRHAHRLQPHGQMILEQLFPGLVDELQAHGAAVVDDSKNITFDYEGHWHSARPRPQVSLSCSRVLLDSTIYQRLAAFPNVRIIQGFEVAGLRVDDKNERVTGVRMHCRRCLSDEMELPADLVVDASGRNSKAPQWLESLGYTPPEEWSIDSFVGYATRIYERPADFDDSWKTLYVQPMPPDGTRGGAIIPIEGNRWHVSLIGVAEDYPPLEDDAFLEFAQSLPTPRFYEAIKAARPLTKPVGFQRAASRIRRYDKLPRYLEGFLVCGDAAYILNPVYAQGMTAAAIGSQALDQCLAQQPQGDLTGLSHAFQTQLSHSLRRLWHMVTSQDWRWSATTITDNSDDIYLNYVDSRNLVPNRN